jgi:hypothetical protein
MAGIITLKLSSIAPDNSNKIDYRIITAINYCENIIIQSCTNIQFNIKFTTDIHLEKSSKFNNVLFSADNTNIFGENI